VTEIIIYTSVALIAGFALAWILRSITVAKLQKQLHNTEGSWDREKLMKETAQKETAHAYASFDAAKMDWEKKLKNTEQMIAVMDNDILLLQKNNEETEALLKATNPELHHLKLQLIEANNSIARYKAQLGLK
jgi:septal ring factor EnvC (AmiA/AmiB activator)